MFETIPLYKLLLNTSLDFNSISCCQGPTVELLIRIQRNIKRCRRNPILLWMVAFTIFYQLTAV